MRQRTTSVAAQEAVVQAKAMGVAEVTVVAALHQVDRRTSSPVMSVDITVRWGIGHVSVARSPRRSRRMSCKTRRRGHSSSRQP
jgi:hypothetical protein